MTRDHRLYHEKYCALRKIISRTGHISAQPPDPPILPCEYTKVVESPSDVWPLSHIINYAELIQGAKYCVSSIYNTIEWFRARLETQNNTPTANASSPFAVLTPQTTHPLKQHIQLYHRSRLKVNKKISPRPGRGCGAGMFFSCSFSMSLLEKWYVHHHLSMPSDHVSCVCVCVIVLTRVSVMASFSLPLPSNIAFKFYFHAPTPKPPTDNSSGHHACLSFGLHRYFAHFLQLHPSFIFYARPIIRLHSRCPCRLLHAHSRALAGPLSFLPLRIPLLPPPLLSFSNPCPRPSDSNFR